jgi:hypothetical protein
MANREPQASTRAGGAGCVSPRGEQPERGYNAAR